MSHSAPHSVADTTLGFTASELQIFRQQQQVLAQRAHQESVASRGRGTSRHSQPSSRAASAASSGGAGQGRVFLDPRSLQTLHAHFDNLMRTIGGRIDTLEEAIQRSTQASSDRAAGVMQNADNEITRVRRILAEIDSLEADFARVKNINQAVKRIKTRVEEMSDKLERSHSSSQGSSHGSGRHAPRPHGR